MLRDFFAKTKKDFWPEIKDWSSSMDHIRLRKDVKNLSLSDWAWFHPSCYKLIFLGTFPVIGIFLSLAILVILLKGYPSISLFFSAIMAAYSFVKCKERIQQRKTIEGMTFYDVYLRE